MQTSRLNRRQFIKRTGLAAAAFSAAPYVIAQDKTGTRLPVIGTGDHQYEVIHDWGELPAGHVYGNTHGVAVDAQGFVHIKHTVGAGASGLGSGCAGQDTRSGSKTLYRLSRSASPRSRTGPGRRPGPARRGAH